MLEHQHSIDQILIILLSCMLILISCCLIKFTKRRYSLCSLLASSEVLRVRLIEAVEDKEATIDKLSSEIKKKDLVIAAIKYQQGGKKLHGELRKSIKTLVHKKQDYTCQYCGVKCNPAGDRKITIDHVIPRSAGGTNALDNLVSCCSLCNTLKAGDNLDLFKQKLLYGKKKRLHINQIQPHLSAANPLPSLRDVNKYEQEHGSLLYRVFL